MSTTINDAQGNTSGHANGNYHDKIIKHDENAITNPIDTTVDYDDKTSLIPNIEDNTMLKRTPATLVIIPEEFVVDSPEDNLQDNNIKNSKNGLPPIVIVNSESQPKARCSLKPNFLVELVIFLTMLGTGFGSLTNGTFLLYKICYVRFNNSHEECLNITSDAATSKGVQDMAADYALYRSLLEVFPSVIVSVFAGPWSDIHGRKPLIVFPIVGFTLSSILYLVALVPEIPPEFLLLNNLVSGCFGGLTALMVGAFSYVSDLSSIQKRTLRIAIIDLCLVGAVGIGLGIASAILNAAGFLAVFISTVAVQVLSLVYAVFFLKETVGQNSSVGKIKKSDGLCRNALSTFTTAFKARDGNIRAYIMCLIAATSCMVLPFTGESSIMLLYVTKKFGWDQTKLTIYTIYGMAITLVGTFILFKFILRKLKVPDLIIALIGIVGFIMKALFNAFSPTAWMLYLGSTVSFFQPLAIPVVRSLLTKITHQNELGQIFSFLASCEALVPLFSGIVYTQLYKATVESFPGAAFLFTAAVMSIPTVCFSWIFADMVRKNLTFNLLAEKIQQSTLVSSTHSSETVTNEVPENKS